MATDYMKIVWQSGRILAPPTYAGHCRDKPMSFFLVAPALDWSTELFLSEQTERLFALQWERLKDPEEREAFNRRLTKHLEKLLPEALDWEIKEPTPAQLSYASAISKELGVPIPPDALRSRSVMHAFIQQHAPKAKQRWESRSTKPA